jgi:hypothetical protein
MKRFVVLSAPLNSQSVFGKVHEETAARPLCGRTGAGCADGRFAPRLVIRANCSWSGRRKEYAAVRHKMFAMVFYVGEVEVFRPETALERQRVFAGAEVLADG